MSYRVASCGRCGSKIVDSDHRWPEKQQFVRELGDGEYETDSVRLCSMCLDDVWETVFEVDVDRSDKADPVPLNRAGKNIDRYISDLEDLREELQQ